MKRNLPESSSPGNFKDNEQRLLIESPRRRRIEGAARVPFLGTLPKQEWEVHHRDHENRCDNKVTIKDAYPIPRDDESLSKLGDAKFFTTLDLGSAFWQVPLRKKDREMTGFARELALYQWKRMPFGLCNATATFQRLIAQSLTRVTKIYGNLVMCYVDDAVIATPTLEDHIDLHEKSRLEM